MRKHFTICQKVHYLCQLRQPGPFLSHSQQLRFRSYIAAVTVDYMLIRTIFIFASIYSLPAQSQDNNVFFSCRLDDDILKQALDNERHDSRQQQQQTYRPYSYSYVHSRRIYEALCQTLTKFFCRPACLHPPKYTDLLSRRIDRCQGSLYQRY